MHEPQHTIEQGSEAGNHRKRVEKNNRKKSITRGLMYMLLLIICGVVWWQITFRGYQMAKDYIDKSVQNVQQENTVSIQQLQGRIDALGQEMTQLSESLNAAGGSISNSATVQQRIDEKLVNLDKQLKDLEKSLNVLKEAP